MYPGDAANGLHSCAAIVGEMHAVELSWIRAASTPELCPQDRGSHYYVWGVALGLKKGGRYKRGHAGNGARVDPSPAMG